MIPIHGYVTAHERMRRIRGSATNFKCICGADAREWAYNYQDPNAITDSKGRVYSKDPSFYDPMCRLCHRHFDTYRRVTHCPRGHAYAGDNLILTKDGSRVCRECRNAYQRTLRANFTPTQRKADNTRRRARYKPAPPKEPVTHCPQGHAYEGYNLIIDKR